MFEELNKIKISEKATYRLRQLKGRTGLTPNLLARFALNYSLKLPTPPNLHEYDTDGMEFNRYTLTGAHDMIIMALLIFYMEKQGISLDQIQEQLQAHISRGTMEIFPRIKSIFDVQNILDF
jgi:DNA sulfur modification protein DndE